MNGCREGDIGMDGLASAAQYCGVSALDRECSSVDRDIRARFINDADDAKRHAHFGNLESVRSAEAIENPADWIAEGDDLADAGLHRFEPRLCYRKAVKHIGRHALAPGICDVPLIGLEYLSLVRAKSIDNFRECKVFALRPGRG